MYGATQYEFILVDRHAEATSIAAENSATRRGPRSSIKSNDPVFSPRRNAYCTASVQISFKTNNVCYNWRAVVSFEHPHIHPFTIYAFGTPLAGVAVSYRMPQRVKGAIYDSQF